MEKTIHRIINEKVLNSPDQVAIRINIDLGDLVKDLNLENADISWDRIEKYIFTFNKYIFEYQDLMLFEHILGLSVLDIKQLVALKTNRHNIVIINRDILTILKLFNGKNTVSEIYHQIKGSQYNSVFYSFYSVDSISNKKEIQLGRGDYRDFIQVLKVFYQSNLLDLTSHRSYPPEMNPGSENSKHLKQEELLKISLPPEMVCPKEANPDVVDSSTNSIVAMAPTVLLLGDTYGNATTGLLYLATYLRRNGIKAFCQWNDMSRDYDSMKSEIERLINLLQPQIIAISMKWFHYITRVLEKCRIVKQISPGIKIVIGGNTASYYYEELCAYDFIDFIVRGDGEEPLLKICQGADYLPNCIYKKDGKIIINPITYIQDERNCQEIYLSNLDEVFISKTDPFFTPYFYINTGKGCRAECCYCAGRREVQKISFQRERPFFRGVNEVRRDIIEAKNYASMFMFDFDALCDSMVDYYQSIWKGLDLKDYFSRFYLWKLPDKELLNIISNTFKYSYLNIDLCSMAERHRLQLTALNLVKPQPSDLDIFSFFDECGKYKNIEVGICTILGLPYFTEEDIKSSEVMIEYLIQNYPCFKNFEWGRLHAQPGALLAKESNQHGMYSTAETFDDFLKYSTLNMQYAPSNISTPYIYPEDKVLNKKMIKHELKINQKITEHFSRLKEQAIIGEELTFRELGWISDRIAWALSSGNIHKDWVVALVTDNPLFIILGILAVLKTGAVCLIYNGGTVDFLTDNPLDHPKVQVVLTEHGLINETLFQGAIFYLDDNELYNIKKPFAIPPVGNGLAFEIYTAGMQKVIKVGYQEIIDLLDQPQAEYSLEYRKYRIAFADGFLAKILALFTT